MVLRRPRGARELQLSPLLMLFIGTGLAFILLPGTFLGVWNLLAISAHEAPQSVSPAWLQAHGHAQIFGWIGSFIILARQPAAYTFAGHSAGIATICARWPSLPDACHLGRPETL